MDYNNAIGADIFTDFNNTQFQVQRSISSSSNTSTAFLSLTITDMNQFQNTDYRLEMTCQSSGILTREGDGTKNTLTFNATDEMTGPAASIPVIFENACFLI